MPQACPVVIMMCCYKVLGLLAGDAMGLSRGTSRYLLLRLSFSLHRELPRDKPMASE